MPAKKLTLFVLASNNFTAHNQLRKLTEEKPPLGPEGENGDTGMDWTKFHGRGSLQRQEWCTVGPYKNTRKVCVRMLVYASQCFSRS